MTETVCIIDYGSGNLHSVAKAFERAAAETGFRGGVVVTDDAAQIATADRVVLPGVGAFGACMAGLAGRAGVLEAMEHAVLSAGRPFLGVCVGMQLLAEKGLEFGDHAGLGWIPGRVEAIDFEKLQVSSPHMGWNTVTAETHAGPVERLDKQAFYFAHSYHFVPENAAHAVAYAHHGAPLVAAVARDNILGVQFHPEKSQSAGVAFLAAFLAWSP